MRWVVKATPQQIYPREWPGTHCTGGWVGPRAGLDGCENLAPTGKWSPDRSARSESLYRLSYPSTQLGWVATGSLGKYGKQELMRWREGGRPTREENGMSICESWRRENLKILQEATSLGEGQERVPDVDDATWRLKGQKLVRRRRRRRRRRRKRRRKIVSSSL